MRIVAPMMITATAANARPSASAGDAGDVAQPIELRDPLLAVANVVDERECSGSARRPLCTRRRIAEARLELHVDRRRQELRLEDVPEFAELAARALERLLLRDDVDVRRLRGYFAMSSAAAAIVSTVVPSATNARISTRSSTLRRARCLMLSATRPNSPNANSENAIVVTLNTLSSGARRKASNAVAKREHQSTLRLDARRVGRIEHELAVIQLDRAVIGAANELEVVRRHDHRGARRVDLAKELEDAARRALVEIARRLVGDEHERIVDERAGERDALLLAAGQLAGKGRRLRRETDLGQQRAPPCRRSLACGVPITSSAKATFARPSGPRAAGSPERRCPARRRSFGDVTLLDCRRSCSR